MAGTPKTAVVRDKGGVMVRNNADEGYDYRVRTLDFANSDTPLRRVPGTCRRAG
ncbi:hypothetical protein W59_07784 [Rhodococcus opacus RKJ300 = JCM 13270]|uniref:Uncharacterized protein n=1 Tax=Rhodococcus opacus RKJ300 = JCM 13270 TaxID=1165867 RepID=I0WVV5_RHOOP|nr:hypothetical protein W59_07784 [Rhodococcus opacus RKJ300 = JCM 13270]